MRTFRCPKCRLDIAIPEPISYYSIHGGNQEPRAFTIPDHLVSEPKKGSVYADPGCHVALFTYRRRCKMSGAVVTIALPEYAKNEPEEKSR